MKKILNHPSFAPVLVCALIALLLAITPLHSQTGNQGVHTLQVTIGAGVTQISATSLPVHQVMFQNNATHAMRIGDSLTTSSRGGQLASGSPGGSLNAGTFQYQQTNLNQWFVAGTQNDVIDIVFID